MLRLLTATAISLTAVPSAAQELTVTRVFDDTVETGRYKHAASLTELANGDLYLVYYGGEGEYADRTAVFGSRLTKGAGSWTPPVTVASDPAHPLGNAVAWQAPDGLVWLFYVVRYGETWSTSRIEARTSSDGAGTWSEPSVLHDRPGMMVRNLPIVLHDGDYLLPVYHETGDDTESVGPESTSRFLRFDAPRGRGARAGSSGRRGATSSRASSRSPRTTWSPTAAAAATTSRRPAAGSCAPNRTTAARRGRRAATPRSRTPTRRSSS
jgi:hypothetical protein